VISITIIAEPNGTSDNVAIERPDRKFDAPSISVEAINPVNNAPDIPVPTLNRMI
jgi:hypothetical protein